MQSGPPASATAQSASPVEGSSTGSVRPDRASRRRPPITSSFGHRATASHSASAEGTSARSSEQGHVTAPGGAARS